MSGLRQELQRAFSAATNRLNERHWGTPAPGSKGAPRYYVFDLRGLLLAAGVLRYELSKNATRLFYRGQTQDWKPIPSLYRGATTSADIGIREAWVDRCISEVAGRFDPKGTPDAREALAQHYGLKTRWLDVVDNVQTAAWFAISDATSSQDARRDASVGYIQLLACPDAQSSEIRAYDLRTKPSNWARPHIQQAWAVAGHPQAKYLGSLSRFHVCTFIVPQPLLSAWSGRESLTTATMFPNQAEDEGLRFWLAAEEHLRSRDLLPPPWLRSRP